ncbi:MAG: response regulator [Gemmataceae bacterium]|nr:response regulator [Gemmataceae bacterium]MCI0739120.1 response regulator [Gemmataceae bacterium]
MKDMLRIAIVDPSDSTREPLRNLLLGVESVWLEAECSRYEFFIDVAKQSNPDLVVITLDSDHNKALQLIQTLTADFAHMPILAVSARGDGQSILHALRAGAKEFLTAPVVLEELLQALTRLRTNRVGADGMPASNGQARVESSVVSVLGSRGGVGCTSLAVNLGVNLAQDSNHSVALIDLDLALGDADVALDLVPDYTLADVALNIDRLDMTFLRRSLCKHETGLYLLPHPVQMEDIALIHEDHLSRVIGLLRASYTHLIFDLSKRFTPTDWTAMRMSDVILLVAQLELTSLRNVVRMLHTLGNEEGLGDRIQVVVNRVGSEDGEITLKKAEETIGRPIYWQVPNDYKPMLGARNAGVPLLTFAPKCKAQQSLVALANSLSGKDPQQPGQKKERRGFFSFR